jgi:hypothetical protein
MVNLPIPAVGFPPVGILAEVSAITIRPSVHSSLTQHIAGQSVLRWALIVVAPTVVVIGLLVRSDHRHQPDI